MNHTGSMSKIQRGRDIFCDPQCHIHRQLPFASDARTERLSFNQGHDVTRHVCFTANEEDGHDVGMVQGSRRLGFAPEPLCQFRARHQIWVEHLDREASVESLIVNAKDDGRTALADQFLHSVVVTQRQAHLLGQGRDPVAAVAGEHCTTFRAAECTHRSVLAAFVADLTGHSLRLLSGWSGGNSLPLVAVLATDRWLDRD